MSPFGGWEWYRVAYRALSDSDGERTFVILGTSHYGEPDRFGLTRKRFRTPYGEAVTYTRLVDELASRADGAVLMEDYCHAVEHSIEFQVVLLQHRFGPGVRVLPILCGPFAQGTREGGFPRTSPPWRASSRPWPRSPGSRATACSPSWASTWPTWDAATATPSRPTPSTGP